MNGKITEVEIERAAEGRRESEKENDQKTPKILKGLMEGKSCLEIAQDVSLSKSGVKKRKNKLIAERKDNSRRNRISSSRKKKKRKERKSLKT